MTFLPKAQERGHAQAETRPAPLRERVYEALLELIITRALQPGQHLVESELAAHLGVSRQPVREALQRLNTEGWVDLRPGAGRVRARAHRGGGRPASRRPHAAGGGVGQAGRRQR